MKVHRTAYRAMKAWAGDSKRRQKQLADSERLLKRLLKHSGEIEVFQAPPSEGYRFFYIVTKPTDWLVLKDGARVGRAWPTKVEAMHSVGEKKAKRTGPSVYEANGYTVARRDAL